MTAVDVRLDPDVAAEHELPEEPRGRNLMAIPAVAALLRSRWYPDVIQVPVAAVFGLVAYQLLAGPDSAHDNAGTALMWVLWWPVIPIVFLLLGRFWCAVCPFATLSDLVQKLVGLRRPVPAFLKRYGIWIIDASFLAITWADHVWGIVGSPWGSGVLLLMPVSRSIHARTSVQASSIVRFWIRTMPMIAIARKDSSTFGARRNHSSRVGLRTVTVIASFGQDLMQLAHRLQCAEESMVRGKLNNGQAATVSVPL